MLHIAIVDCQNPVDPMWTDWLIPGVIPFTIPQKDTTLLRIDMKAKPLHAQNTV